MSIHSIDINHLLVHYKDMKTEQLQIRVSSELKANIRKRASAANMDMSEWVLAALFPPVAREFQHLCAEIVKQGQSSNRFCVFAALSDFLQRLDSDELVRATLDQPDAKLDELSFNYVAAMVELACHRKKIKPAAWLHDAEGLSEPYFGSPLLSLRLYLLAHALVPFKKRNIFIDSSVGDRL